MAFLCVKGPSKDERFKHTTNQPKEGCRERFHAKFIPKPNGWNVKAYDPSPPTGRFKRSF